jgi:hypothetical protein
MTARRRNGAGWRYSGLERLVRGHDGPSTSAPDHRSTQDRRQRRSVPVDELARLGAYTAALSLGDCIACIARACGPHGLIPERSFSAAMRRQAGDRRAFSDRDAPSALDFAASIATVMPETRVQRRQSLRPGRKALSHLSAGHGEARSARHVARPARMRARRIGIGKGRSRRGPGFAVPRPFVV